MLDEVNIKLVSNIPDVKSGDNLNEIIYKAINRSKIKISKGDIICIAHKIISKAEGCIVDLSLVKPSEKAIEYAEKLNKDPRKVEVILNESKRVVRHFRHPGQNEGVMICEHKLGFISANAAVDQSNVNDLESVITLPKNPDLSARKIKKALEKKFNTILGIVITDTFGRPWRLGQVNIAIGIAGIPATKKEQGKLDSYGRPLLVTEPAFADEISAASGLLIQKSQKTPVVIFQGLEWEQTDDFAVNLIRKTQENMFK